MQDYLNFFPPNISNILNKTINDKFDELEEIRLRVGKPIIIKYSNDENVLNYIINRRWYNQNITNYLW